MRLTYQITGLLFLAMGVLLVVGSRNLTYMSKLGPGPGFFPFWIGILLAGMSLLWFWQVSVSPMEPVGENFVPTPQGLVRVAAILAGITFFGLLVDVLGFRLTMLALMLCLLTLLGRANILVTAAVSLAGSFGLYHVFTSMLGVYLPGSSVDLLRSLGL